MAFLVTGWSFPPTFARAMLDVDMVSDDADMACLGTGWSFPPTFARAMLDVVMVSDDADMSFLGTGWSFPPTFARAMLDVVMVSDDVDIQQSLWILFSTVLGERIMLPQYGTQLGQMVVGALTTTLALH